MTKAMGRERGFSRTRILCARQCRLSTAVVVVVILCLGVSSTTIGNVTPELSLSSWMGQLSPAALHAPLTRLTLLGSHDSATHKLNISATPAMQDSTYQIVLDVASDPVTGPLVSGPIHDLTVTQRMAIHDQLLAGIRAFDLRVLYSNVTNSFFFSHSFAAVPVISTLESVALFLKVYSTEVIVVQLTPDYEHQTETVPRMAEVVAIVESILGQWLVSYGAVTAQQKSLANLSVAELVANNSRVLFSATNVNATAFPRVWPSSFVNGFWPNGQAANESITAINAYVPTMPQSNNDELNLIFFTITPDVQSIIIDVIAHLGNLTNLTSLHDYAEEMRPFTLSAVPQIVQVQKKKLNIVSVDWPDLNLTRTVICLNDLLVQQC